MQFPKIASTLAVSLLSFLPVVGQNALPQAPSAEHIVEQPATVANLATAADAETAAATVETASKGNSIVQTALKYLGARYRSGHRGPSAFDCSGFTSYVYEQEDINITRSSRSQFREGEKVESIAELQPGDLVFFGGSRSRSSVGHVGIVTDVDPDNKKFRFIHASRRGIVVDQSTAPYYQRRYIGARRILSEE